MGGEAREVQNPEQTADEKDEDNENEEDLLSQERANTIFCGEKSQSRTILTPYRARKK
jgi:hypothetical protein